MTTTGSEKIIVTLTAEHGKEFEKTGEAIGTYRPGTGKRSPFHIVFLPKGCEPGKTYRVVLHEIKEDRGGRMMYRATAATPEYSERWRDNGDGTASRVTFSRNWETAESEEGVSETRAKVKRDGIPRLYTQTEVVWGASLTDTVVRVTTTTKIPEIEEVVDSNGQFVEREVRDRDAGVQTETHTVTSVEPMRSIYGGTADWTAQRTRLDYKGEPKLYLKLQVKFSGEKSLETNTVSWADLPAAWLAGHLTAPYPVCACGRERVDTPAGKRACGQCEKLATQIACIDQHLPSARREELTKLGRELCSGQALAGEDGEALVRAYQHLRDNHMVSAYVQREMTGYPWYYATADAIWGSKFSPDALQIVAVLTQASGAGLHRLAVWIAGGQHRKADCEGRDFFYRTQVQGEAVIMPALVSHKLSDASVAVKLVDLEGIKNVQKAREQLAAETLTAEQAERNRLRDLLAHDYVRDNLDLARRIDAFVAEAFRLRGAKDATRILQEEYDAAYGRSRRADGIAASFDGIDHQGLDWATDRDIVPVAFWAEFKLVRKQTKGGKSTKPEPSAPVGPPVTGDKFMDGLAALRTKFGSKK